MLFHRKRHRHRDHGATHRHVASGAGGPGTGAALAHGKRGPSSPLFNEIDLHVKQPGATSKQFVRVPFSHSIWLLFHFSSTIFSAKEKSKCHYEVCNGNVFLLFLKTVAGQQAQQQPQQQPQQQQQQQQQPQSTVNGNNNNTVSVPDQERLRKVRPFYRVLSSFLPASSV